MLHSQCAFLYFLFVCHTLFLSFFVCLTSLSCSVSLSLFFFVSIYHYVYVSLFLVSVSICFSLCVFFLSLARSILSSQNQNMDFDDTGVQGAPAQSELICKKNQPAVKNTLRYLHWNLLRLHQLLRGSTSSRHSLLHL